MFVQNASHIFWPKASSEINLNAGCSEVLRYIYLTGDIIVLLEELKFLY